MVANEYDYSRAEILKENVAKWGNPATVITRGDTSQYRKLRETFDVIAVDAPCSGEGMMRKDRTAREQWSPALVEECRERQWEILTNLWEALRPGGFLVYSTCTFNTAENELTADRLRRELGAIPVDTGLTAIDGIDIEVTVPGVEPLHSLRFIPGRARGEGLFMTLLRKPGNLTPAIRDIPDGSSRQKKGKQKGQSSDKQKLPAEMMKACRGWLSACLLYTSDAADEL